MGQSKQNVQTGGSQTEYTQSLAPWQQDAWQGLLGRMGDQQYQPYTGQRVAGPTANQQAAWDMAGQIGGMGQEQMNAATQAAMNATGYSPQQVQADQITAASAGPFQGAQAGSVGPIQQVQAQNVNTAGTAGQTGGVYGQLRGNIRDVNAGQFGNLSPYMNEYNNQVVNTALGDVERARQMATNQTGDAAVAAGAFGGSRHGVAESLTNAEYARQSARTAADLRARGFDTAAALQQQDMNRSLQAQGMNQGADAGLLGQAFGQTNQNALANQSANLQAGLANQATDLSRGQTNASLGTQASIANMQGRLQNNQFNANLAQNAALANQGANLQAGMANQGAGLAANGQRLQGAGMLGNLGAQAQGMGINGMNALGWAGGQERDINQAGLNANYDNFLNQQGWNQQNIQNFIGALGSMPALINGTSNTQNSQTFFKDNLGQIMGGASMLYGIGQDQGWWGGNGGGQSGMGAPGSNMGPQYGGPTSWGSQMAPNPGGMIGGGAGAMNGGIGNQNLNAHVSPDVWNHNPKGQQSGSVAFGGPMMNYMSGG